MIVGVPKEIKNHEYRVGLIPSVVKELVKYKHKVLIETKAGESIGFDDKTYRQCGATIVPKAKDIFAKAEMIVKVKEPQRVERKMLRPGQILFTYLHLAPDRPQTEDLIKSKAICIAYETITSDKGGLPLLTPMSEVAGKMSVQVGAQFLEKPKKGKGVLLGGVPGVKPAKVVIIGGGVVGMNAATIAVGMGARVVILDRSLEVLRNLILRFGSRVETVFSNQYNLERHLSNADLVVGGVLIPGAKAPKLVTRKMLKKMEPGTVLVDVAIDQGGCFETSKATTHDNPVYIIDNIVHYCVANMPGAFAYTSSQALNNATFPYTLALANKGYLNALKSDHHLANGLNVINGYLTCHKVARSFKDLPYQDIGNFIK